MTDEGCSSSSLENIPDTSIHSNKSKEQLTHAFEHCRNLLIENNLIVRNSASSIPSESRIIGEEMYTRIVEMLGENVLIDEEELIFHNEQYEEDSQLEIEDNKSDASTSTSGSGSGNASDVCSEKKMKFTQYIPLAAKIKTVRAAQLHPKWSLKTLQVKGSQRLKSKDDLKRWEQDVLNGGTIIDKFAAIDSWTHDRFIEAKEQHLQVTTRNLQEWALSAGRQYQSADFHFKASPSWVAEFKRKHNIRQRKITKFISHKEHVNMQSTLEAAERFSNQLSRIANEFDSSLIINTDQMGCQYQSTYDRTLTTKGSKCVLVKRRDLNKISHSYTSQYAITMSGRLLPFVFLCLQEPTGAFGPRVQKTIDDLTSEFSNVIVTASKSGKLTTQLYQCYLDKVLKPYVQENKFLLVIDSWGGQTNPLLYDEVFCDGNNMPTCTVKVIPPKCTSICQPLDVYFHRQLKNFIKKLQNCSYLLENNREIASREDAIKIHSLLHHQLSAPIFSDMIKYAWFASKLCPDRRIFSNVNEICFPLQELKTPCACHHASFICCSRCRVNLCFICFYENYHPKTCTDVAP